MIIDNLSDINNVHDTYFQFVESPQFVGPIQADVAAFVGESVKGPVDRAFWVASPTDFKRKFGGMAPNPANPTRPLSGYPTFLAFHKRGVQDKAFVRVINSLGKTAYITVSNSAGDMFSLHAATEGAYSPGTWASSLAVTISANPNTDLFDLHISNADTGERDDLIGLPFGDNTVLINTINAYATLVKATQPVYDAPSAAPTATPNAGGSFAPGDFRFVASYYKVLPDGTIGETLVSPETAQISVSANDEVVITLPSLTGTDGIRVYGTNGASGTETYWGQSANGQYSVTFTQAPAASSTYPSYQNTALKGAGDTSAAPSATSITFPTTASTGKNPGNDGAGADTTRYIGAAGTPSTGLYAFAGLTPVPAVVVLAEDAGGDVTHWADQAQVARDNGWLAVVTFPRGTSDTDAISTYNEQTALLGSSTAKYIKAAWNWINIQDNEYYKGPIATSPAAHLAASTAVQKPNTSAASKALNGVIGPEFQITRSQLNSLIASNINAATSLIPVKGVGFGSDKMLSGDDSYLIRMRLLIAAGWQALGGQFCDQPNNPDLWEKCRSVLTAYLDNLAEVQQLIPTNGAAAPTDNGSTGQAGSASGASSSGSSTSSAQGTGTPAGTQPSAGATTDQSQNYTVTCDASNNLVNGRPTKKLYAYGKVRIDPNVDQVVFMAEIGSDVQVSSAVTS